MAAADLNSSRFCPLSLIDPTEITALSITDIIIKLRGLIIGEVLRSYLLEYWESRPAVL